MSVSRFPMLAVRLEAHVALLPCLRAVAERSLLLLDHRGKRPALIRDCYRR